MLFRASKAVVRDCARTIWRWMDLTQAIHKGPGTELTHLGRLHRPSVSGQARDGRSPSFGSPWDVAACIGYPSECLAASASVVDREDVARWINYQDDDDRGMEIGRPLIRTDARRHQEHAARPARPAPPIPTKRVLIVRQPGDVVMRRCPNRAAAVVELQDLPRGSGYRYEIRD
jgi:hypothetical protein